MKLRTLFSIAKLWTNGSIPAICLSVTMRDLVTKLLYVTAPLTPTHVFKMQLQHWSLGFLLPEGSRCSFQEESRCFALGNLSTLALLGTRQIYSVFLMPQRHGVVSETGHFCAPPKKLSACSLVKHRLFIPAFYSQVSSHNPSLGLLSTYLRLLYLYLFQ